MLLVLFFYVFPQRRGSVCGREGAGKGGLRTGNNFRYIWYVIWIIFEIHVLNLSVKIWGYCTYTYWTVHCTLYTFSVRSCENIGQSDDSKVALLGSKFEYLLRLFIVNPDEITCIICKIIAVRMSGSGAQTTRLVKPDTNETFLKRTLVVTQ